MSARPRRSSCLPGDEGQHDRGEPVEVVLGRSRAIVTGADQVRPGAVAVDWQGVYDYAQRR